MRIESDILKTAGVLAVMAAAFVFAVWLPQRAETNRLRDEIQQRRQREQDQHLAQRQFSSLRKQVASLQQEFDSLGKTIPTSGDVSPFLGQLGAELSRASLADSEIQSETVISGSEMTVIPLTFRIRGSYEQLFSFLKAVESGNRLVRVNDLKITGTPLKRDEPLDIRLELCTFATKQERSSP